MPCNRGISTVSLNIALEDIESELKWQQTLEQPQERLVKLAEKALQQSLRGETIKAGFDEI
jgi:hypothetical protein